MDSSSQLNARVDRELASLKILSRLLGHELHAQAGQRVTLSREEVLEMQTTLDNYIAAVSRNRPMSPNGVANAETAPIVSARMN